MAPQRGSWNVVAPRKPYTVCSCGNWMFNSKIRPGTCCFRCGATLGAQPQKDKEAAQTGSTYADKARFAIVQKLFETGDGEQRKALTEICPELSKAQADKDNTPFQRMQDADSTYMSTQRKLEKAIARVQKLHGEEADAETEAAKLLAQAAEHEKALDQAKKDYAVVANHSPVDPVEAALKSTKDMAAGLEEIPAAKQALEALQALQHTLATAINEAKAAQAAKAKPPDQAQAMEEDADPSAEPPLKCPRTDADPSQPAAEAAGGSAAASSGQAKPEAGKPISREEAMRLIKVRSSTLDPRRQGAGV